jgi:hypothetical protein
LERAVTKWLTAEWFDQTRAMAADQPAHPGLSVRIQHTVTGGPDGDISYFWVLDDGRIQSGGGGTVEQPDVTLTSVWNDAVSMCRGDLDPSVAFMQGRLKVAGSMGAMLVMLPLTNTTEYRDWRRRVAEITDF